MGQILLVLKIPVSGDEDREPGSPCLCEQCAVLEPGLGLLLHRPDLVARKVPRELPWQLLIEENAHERSQPRGPPRGRPRLVPSTLWETSRETRPGCGSVPEGAHDVGSDRNEVGSGQPAACSRRNQAATIANGLATFRNRGIHCPAQPWQRCAWRRQPSERRGHDVGIGLAAHRRRGAGTRTGGAIIQNDPRHFSE